MSQSIHYLSLEGNPIGNIGVRQIIKAKNENEIVDFEINLKGSDGEISTAAESEKKIKLFNPDKPEGGYSLNLEVIYDKLILYQLLDLSLEASKNSATISASAFEQKACFAGVKYNGKSNWSPPTQKQVSGLWDLKETPNGILEFHFTIDPPAYKLEM